MVGQLPDSSRFQALRHSQRVLQRMAPLVRFGLFSVGVSVFLNQIQGLISDAQFTWGERRVMGIVALITFGGFGLGSWVAGRLLKASADLIEVFIATAESASRTADLIELHLVPSLGRIAAALEREDPAPAASRRNAEQDHQSAPAVIQKLRQDLESARRADDAERVIGCRDALTEHLRGEALHELDGQVVRWLVGRIQAQSRSGTPSDATAAAVLAARVLESFGDVPEAASLRAALPRLRRSAGLCPRCGRATTPAGDICPRCGAAATPVRPGRSEPEFLS